MKVSFFVGVERDGCIALSTDLDLLNRRSDVQCSACWWVGGDVLLPFLNLGKCMNPLGRGQVLCRLLRDAWTSEHWSAAEYERSRQPSDEVRRHAL
jgi:hypothetical protein